MKALFLLVAFALIFYTFKTSATSSKSSIADDGTLFSESRTDQNIAIEDYLKKTYSYLYPTEDTSQIGSFLSLSPELFTKASAINSKGPFHKIVAGLPNRFVLGLKNYWFEPLHVLGVSGFITTPDFSRSVRNISFQRQWTSVSSLETASLILEFIPDFEAPSMGLILLVEFTDRHKEVVYHSIAYKEIIQIVSAPDSLYDTQTFLLLVIFLGFFGLAVSFFKRKIAQKSVHQKKK